MSTADIQPVGTGKAVLAPLTLLERYRAARGRTMALARSLSAEDQLVQSMPDASPTKWHLAHTTWFFETFVLSPYAPGYRAFDVRWAYLFNSYYEALGPHVPRPDRGSLSRPLLDEVHAYRLYVDAAVERVLGRDGNARTRDVCELGIQHEQQYQELILTDIKHAFARNPLRPAYRGCPAASQGRAAAASGRAEMRVLPGGLVWIGHDGAGFAFDNEGPRHQSFLSPFAIADRPVTCGEYAAFIRDRGYQRPELWLSDGWDQCQRQQWQAPLYWQHDGDTWMLYTLAGPRALDEIEAVAHVSYYEADAFARWAGMRLPTEEEWEHAARLTYGDRVDGRFATDEVAPHPGPARPELFGNVWQWTQSPYAAYPGYRPPSGAIGEYNGKFMCNQMVLRGGSCFTPAGHVRATYRNFFPPAARWQASGIRLARDE